MRRERIITSESPSNLRNGEIQLKIIMPNSNRDKDEKESEKRPEEGQEDREEASGSNPNLKKEEQVVKDEGEEEEVVKQGLPKATGTDFNRANQEKENEVQVSKKEEAPDSVVSPRLQSLRSSAKKKMAQSKRSGEALSPLKLPKEKSSRSSSSCSPSPSPSPPSKKSVPVPSELNSSLSSSIQMRKKGKRKKEEDSDDEDEESEPRNDVEEQAKKKSKTKKSMCFVSDRAIFI